MGQNSSKTDGRIGKSNTVDFENINGVKHGRKGFRTFRSQASCTEISSASSHGSKPANWHHDGTCDDKVARLLSCSRLNSDLPNFFRCISRLLNLTERWWLKVRDFRVRTMSFLDADIPPPHRSHSTGAMVDASLSESHKRLPADVDAFGLTAVQRRLIRKSWEVARSAATHRSGEPGLSIILEVMKRNNEVRLYFETMKTGETDSIFMAEGRAMGSMIQSGRSNTASQFLSQCDRLNRAVDRIIECMGCHEMDTRVMQDLASLGAQYALLVPQKRLPAEFWDLLSEDGYDKQRRRSAGRKWSRSLIATQGTATEGGLSGTSTG